MVFPIADILFPVTSRAPSKMISRDSLTVMIVQFVYRVDCDEEVIFADREFWFCTL